MQPSKPPSERTKSAAHMPRLNQKLQTQIHDQQPHVHSYNTLVSPERHELFNKQSGKVNAGLNFGAAQDDGEDIKSPFACSIADLGIDLRSFIIAVPANPKVEPVTKDIVRCLLAPPPHAFPHGVLSLNWIISVAGARHFKYRKDDGRYVLTATSELRLRGKELGLPAAYYEWLCGDDPERSASEEGMMLTRDFFEKEV